MNRPVAIVVLSKFFDVYKPFYDSIKKYAIDYPIYCVVDGSSPDPLEKWESIIPSVTVIKGPDTFSMAGNGNLGMKAVPIDHDILYCGDDVRLLKPKTIEKLQEVAYEYPDIGILTPRIIGRGSQIQVNPKEGVSDVPPIQMWFPCIYIKRELIEKIGYLDEQFNRFGSDDLDFCIRTKITGYKLAITSGVVIFHQASQEGGPTTFCKAIGAEEWRKQEDESLLKLRLKWKVPHNIFDRFLMTGDVSLLTKPDNQGGAPLAQLTEPSKDDALEYLKTRSLFIATPCYGGMMTLNYVQSVIQLITLCVQHGISYTTAFFANESLITRGRNKAANDFMSKSTFTDFVFIDADIGFEPKDVIALLLHEGDIIGAPCPRKSLRLDRIVEATKRNGRAYSNDELQAMLGEFVLNFPHDQIPKSINLGQLLEVKEVGTGLMMIRRETFKKFMAAYPDRYYLAMSGETDCNREPMFMFFQAGMDEETKNWNPGGVPDYISEDYWFCRDARRAGMHVYVAPWMKTTHAGTYIFQGDLQAVAQAGGVLK